MRPATLSDTPARLVMEPRIDMNVPTMPIVKMTGRVMRDHIVVAVRMKTLPGSPVIRLDMVNGVIVHGRAVIQRHVPRPCAVALRCMPVPITMPGLGSVHRPGDEENNDRERRKRRAFHGFVTSEGSPLHFASLQSGCHDRAPSHNLLYCIELHRNSFPSRATKIAVRLTTE